MSTAPVTAQRPATQLGGPLRWVIAIIAVTAIATSWSVIVINTARGWPQGYWPLLVMVSNASVATAYLAVGWLLTERRPRNLVGPLLLLYGLLWATFAPCDLYLSQVTDGVDTAKLPLAQPAALYVMVVGYVLVPISVLVLVLFPNGRPLSRWWLLVAMAGCALILLGAVANTIGTGAFSQPYDSITSPLRIPGFRQETLLEIADAAIQVMVLFSVVALAARWYRGSQVERAQVKWVALASFVIFAVGFVAEQFDDGPWDWPVIISGLVAGFSGVLLPLAIGVAILRYRLYDIDRVVSRGVAYGGVSIVLAGVFVGVNLVSLGVISTLFENEGDTLSAAVATLSAAALFTPVRNRAQRVVDRRFHRSHYDAQRVVDAFGGRLRDQTDLAFVHHELRAAAVTAVEPVTTALWLRPDRTGRETAGTRP